MIGRRTAVFFGIVVSGISLACGRELAAPTHVEVDTNSQPEELALVAQNRYVCSIVIWSGDQSNARQSLRFRKTLPLNAGAESESETAGGSASQLARYGFMRFDRESGSRRMDALCVLPRESEAREDAAAFFRQYDPLANEVLDAARRAGVNFSWANGGDVWCTYDANNLYCEGGVTCALMARAPADGPSFSRRMAPAATGSTEMSAVCDNGCDVLDFVYTCGGGSGTVDYEEGGSGGAGLNVSCTTPVVRGSTTSCTLNTSGTLGTVIDYSFQGTGSMHRPPDIVGPNWGGTMVESGDVTAVAVVDGDTVTSNTFHIDVTPRAGWPWTGAAPYSIWSLGSSNLPLKPHAPEDLGYTTDGPLFVDGISARIGDNGPNDGRYYLTGMYTQIYSVRVNYAAMTTGTDFVNAQSPTTNGNACTQAFASSGLRNVVETHEGVGRESGSHTDRYQDTFEDDGATIGSLMEAWHDGGDIAEYKVRLLLAAQFSAAHAYSEALDSPPPPGPCNINFSYP